MPGRPLSLRAVRERLFDSLRTACLSWHVGFAGRAPTNEDTENSFLRLITSWETFLSNWIIYAVVRDPSVLVAKLQADLSEWLARKYGMTAPELATAGFAVRST